MLRDRLQFRSAGQLVDDLASAGLAVTNLSADWQGRPFTGAPGDLLMIVEVS